MWLWLSVPLSLHSPLPNPSTALAVGFLRSTFLSLLPPQAFSVHGDHSSTFQSQQATLENPAAVLAQMPRLPQRAPTLLVHSSLKATLLKAQRPGLICSLIPWAWDSFARHRPHPHFPTLSLWPHSGEGHVDNVESALQPRGDDSPSTPWRAHGGHQEHVLESRDKDGRDTVG